MKAPVDDRVFDRMAALAGCLCRILSDQERGTCFCGVVPGADVAVAAASECVDADHGSTCGVAWVRMTSFYPSNGVAVVSERPGNCSTGVGLTIEMGVVRCVTWGDEQGNGPTDAEMLESAREQYADLMAMRQAVACCGDDDDWQIVSYMPSGPDGGILGGTLTLEVEIL